MAIQWEKFFYTKPQINFRKIFSNFASQEQLQRNFRRRELIQFEVEEKQKFKIHSSTR